MHSGKLTWKWCLLLLERAPRSRGGSREGLISSEAGGPALPGDLAWSWGRRGWWAAARRAEAKAPAEKTSVSSAVRDAL